MKKYYKKLDGKKQMVKEVSSLSDKFDTEKMLEMLEKAGPRRLYIVEKGKDPIACDNFKKFINIISVHGDLEVMHPICFNRAETYHIFSKVDYFNTEPKEDEVEVVEEVLEEKETQEDHIDFSKYESLYDESDKSGSKIKLEEVAKEDFGVDLKRNLSFPKMIEELKSLVEA